MSVVIPRHVGVILDGNGRWAQPSAACPGWPGTPRGRRPSWTCWKSALEAGDRVVHPVFVFSTENWQPFGPRSVSFLMKFCDEMILRRGQELAERGARLHFAGDLTDPRIPEDVRLHIAEILESTAPNRGLNLVVAFNYGGRLEIVEAARQLAADAVAGRIRPTDIDSQALADRLHVPGMPDVDLIIRTSGENRLSNFLLWQGAYAELYFTDVLWPDFNAAHFEKALEEYRRRERRFGRIRESS